MTRTKLEYSVSREPQWDPDKRDYVNKVVHRGFYFYPRAKTKEQHDEIAESFGRNLEDEGIWFDRFADGSHFINEQFMIEVEDMEEKEYVLDIYREWRRERKELGK